MKLKTTYARPINLRHGHTRRTKEPHGKLADLAAYAVSCESLAEALAVRRFELDRTVKSYAEQRVHKVIEIDGVFHHAFPDFTLVRVQSGEEVEHTEVVEVKHAGRRDSF